MSIRSTSNNPALEVPDTAARGRGAASGSLGTYIESIGPELHVSRFSESASTLAFTSVIGNSDDRRIELRTKSPPWRMICALEIQTPRGSYRGTGWLAGTHTVITASHCLHHEQFGGWAQTVTISPGRTWREQPFGAHRSAAFSCAEQWLSEQRIELDIGAIHLAEPVGDALGWFGYRTPDQALLATASVTVSGYPYFADSYDNLCT